jgi:pimeloyl-ACP methyl ester carboxylesterase
VAPLAATLSDDVSFLVIEAAPAVTPAQHERARVVNQMRADGRSQASVERAAAFMDRKFEVGRTGQGWEELEQMAARGADEGWLPYVNRPVSLESLRWNWEHVLSFDPQPVLQRLKVPVLALYAELDRVVDAGMNRPRLEAALRLAQNQDVTVQVLPGANHNFLEATTGGPGEVSALRAFVGSYFDTRVAWILDRVEAGVLPTRAAPALIAAAVIPGDAARR